MTPGTKQRLLAFLAWAPSAALLAGGLALIPLTLASLEPGGEVSRADALGNAVLALFALGFGATGALIVLRRPGNAIGWIFCGTGFLWMWEFFATEYALYALFGRPGIVPGGRALAWVTGWVWAPALALVVTFLPLLFPAGRLESGRQRFVAWSAGACILLATVAGAVGPGELDEPLDSVEPYGIDSIAMEIVGGIGLGSVAVTGLASIALLAGRWRRASGDERQQIKWLGAAAAVLLLTTVTFDAYPGSVAVQGASVLAIPVATGVAIFKYRLYDLDRIIRRTLVYGVLSAGLAGLYFGIVLALQQIFAPVTEGSDLAIAGSMLAVAALFRPARRRIQELVEWRFYRRKVDAERTLELFAARLRREIDLDTLRHELLAVVNETMRPARVSLWLRGWR